MPKLIELNGDLIADLVNENAPTALETLRVNPAEDFNPSSLQGIELIEVVFAYFTDGRGYSIAKILREQFAWQGPIRAVGDITVDQLGYLARCGFDSFALRDDQDLKIAKHYLGAFKTGYQKGYARHE
jgi:uncharacterized protein (DUF934 family)